MDFPSFGVERDTRRLRSRFRLTSQSQIIPKGAYFRLEDFLIVDQFNINLKTLPDNEIDAVLRFVATYRGTHNMNDARDREHLRRELDRYLVSPDRHAFKRIEELEALRAADLREAESNISQLNENISRVSAELEREKQSTITLDNQKTESNRRARLRVKEAETRARCYTLFAVGAIVVVLGFFVCLRIVLDAYDEGSTTAKVIAGLAIFTCWLAFARWLVKSWVSEEDAQTVPSRLRHWFF